MSAFGRGFNSRRLHQSIKGIIMGKPIGKNKKTKKVYQKFSKKVKIYTPREKRTFNPIIIPIGEKTDEQENENN